MHATDYLEYMGMRMTPTAFAKDIHLVGRLWAWQAEREEADPAISLANTDGEAFLHHTASFHVADHAALLKAFEARDDIAEEDDGEWIWLNKKSGERGIAGLTILGSLQLIEDELILNVNSTERLETARQWLDQIVGLSFVRARGKNIEELKTAALDDRLPSKPLELTPEIKEHVKQMIHDNFMRWLDTPVPVLNGKTPRETCRESSGRDKVAMMIRTMPVPLGPEGLVIEVPREAMLRELGL